MDAITRASEPRVRARAERGLYETELWIHPDMWAFGSQRNRWAVLAKTMHAYHTCYLSVLSYSTFGKAFFHWVWSALKCYLYDIYFALLFTLGCHCWWQSWYPTWKHSACFYCRKDSSMTDKWLLKPAGTKPWLMQNEHWIKLEFAKLHSNNLLSSSM